MGKIIETSEFTHNGKKGMKVTIQQRAISKRSAEVAAVPQVAARFPLKASGISILGSSEVNPIAGPVKMYRVDMFVPTRSSNGGSSSQSGTVNSSQMT